MSLLEKMEITVSRTTAQSLRSLAKQNNHISVGEVVDRLTAKYASRDPDTAFSFVMDDIMLMTSELAPKPRIKVFRTMLLNFIILLSDADMDELINDRRDILRRLEKLRDEPDGMAKTKAVNSILDSYLK